MGEVVVVGVGAEVVQADNTSYPFCYLTRNDIYVMKDMSSNASLPFPPPLNRQLQVKPSVTNDLLF